MPIPEAKLHKPEKLHAWFAVASVLMLLSLLWLVKVDYDRPWRGHQDRFFLAKAAFAHLDHLNSVTQERENEIKAADTELADARARDAMLNAQRRKELQDELVKAGFEFARASAPFSRATQVLQVTHDSYERALGARGPDHHVTVERKKQLDEEKERVEEFRKDKERTEDHKKAVARQLRELDAVVVAAEKRLAALKQTQADALARDQQFRGVLSDDGLLGGIPIVKAVFNMPLLDFLAPKNTPSRHEVKQQVLPDVVQNLNYLRTYTTDRCMTCHIAIDDPEFSRATLARKLERSLPGIYEALKQSVNYPPAPKLGGADSAAKLVEGRVTDHWDALSRTQQDEYFKDLLDRVNKYLSSSGRKTVELREPLLAHPDLALFVSVDSPHPLAKIGCTVCHEGNPQETDFVLASHSPTSHKVREDWEERYYDRRAGIPVVTFETVEHYWDHPMHPPKYSEAGCSKCHTEVSDIDEYDGEKKGRRINHGRYLFQTVGCVNCHNVDKLADSRKVGPDLTHVASKLSPAFVQAWAWKPQDFRPSTRMPHFFLQENNRAESANEIDRKPVLRTETEVAAISKYLFAVSKPWKPLPMPSGLSGDANRGKGLFTSLGCLACHSNLAQFGEEWVSKDLMAREGLDAERAVARYKGMTDDERARYAMAHFVSYEETFFEPDEHRFDPDKPYTPPVFTRFAPELSGVGSKVTREWLFSWLQQPNHYAPDTKMPSLRLSDQEALDVAEYLLSLKSETFKPAEFAFNEDRLKTADDLIFSILSTQSSERASRAVMAGEGGELAGKLTSLLKASFGPPEAKSMVESWPLADQKLVFLGSKMISHYGCYACHKIPGFEESTPPGTDLSRWAQKPVGQLDFAFFGHAFHDMRHDKHDVFGHVYPRDDKLLAKYSPAYDLEEQVTHTHAAFAKHKLLNPRIWDREKIKGPYDKLKMPNFYFTEDEAEALTTFLLSRTDPRVNDNLAVDYTGDHAGAIARGRDLTRELNCVGCHQAEDNAPTIQQYFRRPISGALTFDSTNAPPLLVGEGAKLQHQWFHHFLLNVEPLRPWLRVRMPSFNITGAQATTLVQYFAALSQYDAERLQRLQAPIREHIAVDRAKSDKPAEAEAAARETWYQEESFDRPARSLRRFAIDRQLMRPLDLDLVTGEPAALGKSHAELLYRTEFIQKLYSVAYPFVEPPRPLSSPERFDEGRRFFESMGCLKCHVLGSMLPSPARTTSDFVQVYRLDGVTGEGAEARAILNGTSYPIGAEIDGHKLISAENVYNTTGDVTTTAVAEGPNESGVTERVSLKAASAPNLALVHRRLRRDWVHEWMIEPGLIQPGTRMPKNFDRDIDREAHPVAFTLDYSNREALDGGTLTPELRAKLPEAALTDAAKIEVARRGDKWYVAESKDLYTIEQDGNLRVSDPSGASPLEIALAAPAAAPTGDEFDDSAPADPVADLDRRKIPEAVKAALAGKGVTIPPSAMVTTVEPGKKWTIRTQAEFTVTNTGDRLNVYQGRVEFTGTHADHIDLLVDFLYDAGFKGYRAPLVKNVVAPSEAVDPNAVFEE